MDIGVSSLERSGIEHDDSPKDARFGPTTSYYEAVAGKTSEPAESAAFRVCEKLRQSLVPFAGVAGFRSLLLVL